MVRSLFVFVIFCLDVATLLPENTTVISELSYHFFFKV